MNLSFFKDDFFTNIVQPMKRENNAKMKLFSAHEMNEFEHL